MGVLTRAFRPQALAVSTGGPAGVLDMLRGGSPAVNYQQAARAYSGNEIVSAALDLISQSTGEPQIIGRRWRRNRPQIRNERAATEAAAAEIRNEMRRLSALGVHNRPGARLADVFMVRNGFWEEVDGHPLVQLLNHPNPYRSRAQFWAEICLDRYLAGNAYVLKARYTSGLLEGAIAELYRLRPDRVVPVPGNMEAGEPFIKGYDYSIDARTTRRIPVEDIIHFRAPDPLDPYRGLSPVAAIIERVNIDRYMRTFLSTFYSRGGASIGAILNVKGKMDQPLKDDIRTRMRRMFGGGHYDILVSNAEEMTYTPLGLDRGLRDALPKEIDAVNEARITMKLRIPGSIIGLLIGYESSSYANKRQDWQVFWDLTMAPLLSDFDDVLNLSLTPEFSGIDEVAFDLSDIRALQEDSEALKESARKDWQVGLAGFHESRIILGRPANPDPDEIFAVPRAADYVTTARLAEEQHPIEPPPALPPGDVQAIAILEAAARGRTRLEDDPSARAIYDEAVALRARYPHLTWAQISGRVAVSERTLREYRRRFAESEDDAD
ncbi:MAG: phage portal protein [Dehalococcoidia bacterium]